MSFTASDFTSYAREYNGGYGTAAYKAKLANSIVRFVKSDFKRGNFTKELYRGLNSMFGHIAHYDIHGFYSTWFEDDRDRLLWLERVSEWHEYGDPGFTLVDVEKVVRRFVVESGLVEVYRQHVAHVQEANERAILAQLKAKYEG